MLFINWLQNHLLPCPFKQLTGIDCPGCGFQRALIALLRGHLRESFLLYPPAIPLLLILGYYIAGKYIKPQSNNSRVKNYLVILASILVLINYSVKMWGIYYS